MRKSKCLILYMITLAVVVFVVTVAVAITVATVLIGCSGDDLKWIFPVPYYFLSFVIIIMRT